MHPGNSLCGGETDAGFDFLPQLVFLSLVISVSFMWTSSSRDRLTICSQPSVSVTAAGCYFQSLVLKLELSVHRLIYISLHLQRLQHQDDSDVKAQQGAVALCYMNMLSVLVEDFGRFWASSQRKIYIFLLSCSCWEETSSSSTLNDRWIRPRGERVLTSSSSRMRSFPALAESRDRSLYLLSSFLTFTSEIFREET